MGSMDCVRCSKRLCLEGTPCPAWGDRTLPRAEAGDEGMLEAAGDVTLERENVLCRISELVYFCLEMDYRKLGVAFCAELLEAAKTLTGLLRRHFTVIPVICKVGGAPVEDPLTSASGGNRPARSIHIACNPLGQAEILNRHHTDINIVVGLCMGVDCVFTKASRAPVTTLFVKDRSLANNPINALYSEYYRKEVKRTSAAVSETHDLLVPLDGVHPYPKHE
jgi:uncharacterized metal-binding protein